MPEVTITEHEQQLRHITTKGRCFTDDSLLIDHPFSCLSVSRCFVLQRLPSAFAHHRWPPADLASGLKGASGAASAAVATDGHEAAVSCIAS
jgi:hypothetical protein